MVDKVPVRLGWRRMSDGSMPRIGRPAGDGREWPGSYLFHKVVGVGKDGTFEYLGDDCVEDVMDTPSIRRYILDGHLIVTDDKHPLAALNQPDPSIKDEPAKSKKASRKDEK